MHITPYDKTYGAERENEQQKNATKSTTKKSP